MTQRRTQHRALAESRVYQKGLRFYFFAPRPMVNPTTGKVARWHSLCPVTDGVEQARLLAGRIQAFNSTASRAGGDLPGHLGIWMATVIKRRDARRPADPERAVMHDRSTKEVARVGKVVADAFADFDVAQVRPVDVAQFLDQWEGRRAAATYRSTLSTFFDWAARRGLRADNPVGVVKVEKAKPRRRYITDDEFHRIREALLIGADGKRTQSGPSMQRLIGVAYLTLQRITDIRLLRWDQVTANGVHFKPTKTDGTTAAEVVIPMGPALAALLLPVQPEGYVFTSRSGRPYAATGVRTAFVRACARAGVEGATPKDLRAKAVTDAKRAGFTLAEISVATTHSSEAMTAAYVKRAEAPTTAVTLTLPQRQGS
jgi:integrase